MHFLTDKTVNNFYDHSIQGLEEGSNVNLIIVWDENKHKQTCSEQ